VDEVIALDAENRAAIGKADDLRANRNRLSKQIGVLMGQAKNDPSKKEEAEAIKLQVTAQAEELAQLEKKEDELKALAGELDVRDRAHFLGFRRDVPRLLAASDIFVFPSLQEGLPVSQMEAMAVGLPCVVSDVRGNADLVKNGQGGFLRKPCDHEGFAEDIALLLGDPALRESMAQRNRSIMHEYSLEAVLAQMTKLYSELLNG